MLKVDPNPLLTANETRHARFEDVPDVVIARPRRQVKRDLMLLWRKQSARDAVAGLTLDNELFGFTKGQFSLLDTIKALLDKTGPAHMTLSTWTAARQEILELATMQRAGTILSLRYLIDLSFARRDRQAIAAMREAFGPDAIRVTACHSKFATMRNDRWRLVLRGSSNLNMNPRCEDFTVANDPELYDFITTIMDNIWAQQRRSLTDGTVKDQYREFLKMNGEPT